ncbi:MAG TPA: MFS transporter [Candidatus Absconditabacterales bacterium]|nr:MFS transporter [Candidatus Absconditabacterales bacterium]HNG97083.1 MFS transporter [Candidatus Absconditabacterales bacterium]
MNLQKTIIFGAVFLDIIGVSIIIPAFPDLKLYYGISEFQVTMGLTIYSLCAFLAAPLLGQYSDKHGRKWPLVVCVLGTMISYLLLLVTKSYWIFLLSRVINGITGGNISILQAMITDISPDKQTKNKHFGLMGALFGLGFILGPVLGAILLKFRGIHGIFWFGGLFGFIEAVLIIAHYSNTNHPDHNKVLSFNPFQVMQKYLKIPTMRNFLISLFFLGVGGFMINATQGLDMQKLFGTTGAQYGWYLAIVGLIAAINMGFLVPKFRTKFFTNKTLIIMAHIVIVVGRGLIGTTSHLGRYLGLFYLTILLSGYYMTVYNIEIMSHAKPGEIGELSGMLGGLQSLLMFVGPLIGGIMMAFQRNIYRGSALCTVISLAIIIRRVVTPQTTHYH